MSVWTLPSSTDINIVNDFTPLLGISTPNVRFKNVLENTDPQIGSTNNFGLIDYQGFGGYYFFNTMIETSNATRGYVEVTVPWLETSSGTTPIGNTKQAFEQYSGNITFQAIANYPYAFDYWIELNTFTFYYSSTLSFSPYDPEIQDPSAQFRAYFT
jgi:hypothetical protein